MGLLVNYIIFALYLLALPKANIKTITLINYAISILLLVWMFVVIKKQLHVHFNIPFMLQNLRAKWSTNSYLLLGLVFLLMLVNWGIEAIKWQLLLKDIQPLRFGRSFRSIFSGISVSLLTPNRIGEYAGRIIYLKDINKLKGIVANIIGSFAQFIAASSFGILGLCYYFIYNKKHIQLMDMWYVLPALVGSIILLLLFLYIYFNISVLSINFFKHKKLQRLKSIVEIVKYYSHDMLWRMVVLSALRYIVFALQFYFLLHICFVSIAFVPAMFGIYCVFWLMAIVPSIAITEVGMRAGLCTIILSAYTSNGDGLMASSILLWFINLIIPAVLGAVVMFGARLVGNSDT